MTDEGKSWYWAGSVNILTTYYISDSELNPKTFPDYLIWLLKNSHTHNSYSVVSLLRVVNSDSYYNIPGKQQIEGIYKP